MLETKDFVGSWKSDDGACVQLYENGCCKIENINLNKIYFSNKDTTQIISSVGTWEINNINNKMGIVIAFNKVMTFHGKDTTKESKATFNFDIMGSGIFENKPPWILYIWIGDPDEMNKYKFVRIKNQKQ